MSAILSLDLGTTMGWALFKDGKIISGSVCFKQTHFDSADSIFTKFYRWLVLLEEENGPIKEIFFEAVRRHLGTIAAHKYGGFMATLQMFADSLNIPYEGISVGTIKLHATGKGNANKKMMIEAMIKKGHNPKDDNEADALALLYWKKGN